MYYFILLIVLIQFNKIYSKYRLYIFVIFWINTLIYNNQISFMFISRFPCVRISWTFKYTTQQWFPNSFHRTVISETKITIPWNGRTSLLAWLICIHFCHPYSRVAKTLTLHAVCVVGVLLGNVPFVLWDEGFS